MDIRKALALVLLGLSLTAAAEFKVIAEAYEVEAVNLRLPPGNTGVVTFKECSNCETHRVNVTPTTRYVIDEQAVDLAEFRKQIVLSRDASTTVIHDLDSDTITVISATL